ncbi:MAG: translation initiation factor IF-3 [Candidatus Aminicenantales bacterium]
MIDEDKQQIGILPVSEALALAREKDLDLVEIAPQATPPVCRIMDYGKYLYELHKKAQEAKKHQKQIQVKEIKFRPKISIHDYNFKVRHVQRFLSEGHKVKITVMLRGREKSRPELARGIIDRVFENVKETAKQDGEMKIQPWAVSVFLSPQRTGGKDAQIKDTQRGEEKVQNNREEKNSSP